MLIRGGRAYRRRRRHEASPYKSLPSRYCKMITRPSTSFLPSPFLGSLDCSHPWTAHIDLRDGVLFVVLSGCPFDQSPQFALNAYIGPFSTYLEARHPLRALLGHFPFTESQSDSQRGRGVHTPYVKPPLVVEKVRKIRVLINTTPGYRLKLSTVLGVQ